MNRLKSVHYNCQNSFQERSGVPFKPLYKRIKWKMIKKASSEEEEVIVIDDDEIPSKEFVCETAETSDLPCYSPLETNEPIEDFRHLCTFIVRKPDSAKFYFTVNRYTSKHVSQKQKLIVVGFGRSVTAYTLWVIFHKFGTVLYITHKGSYAVIVFSSGEEAMTARMHCHGLNVNDSVLSVFSYGIVKRENDRVVRFFSPTEIINASAFM
ncbi:hypothetical protein T01_8338 [Trichinella spiralis]|uniref:RRM domain-containing protein n=1 Tax=Trichinella spiralis TaxID=6334 RepID=A0A0V1BC71_TRISP|nr:hypothetical protein T01_8338 [Trichinella spiralis]